MIIVQVNIPVILTNLFGSPGQIAGGHVELVMPTIRCEVIGDRFPPPLMVDCSKLQAGGTKRQGFAETYGEGGATIRK